VIVVRRVHHIEHNCAFESAQSCVVAYQIALYNATPLVPLALKVVEPDNSIGEIFPRDIFALNSLNLNDKSLVAQDVGRVYRCEQVRDLVVLPFDIDLGGALHVDDSLLVRDRPVRKPVSPEG